MTQSIAALKASNGVGAATTATVQNLRTSGATSIIVDTVTDWPTKFYGCMGTPHTFVDPITSETITVISEATAVDFVGHIDTGHIEIDAISPGDVDGGSAVGDIVIVRPTTDWANNVATVLGISLNDDGTIKNNAIGSAQIVDGSVGQAEVATGAVVQMVSTTFAAEANGSTQIPLDDTIPQNTEGDQYMTQAITPKSATNKLVIMVDFFGSFSQAAVDLILALFQDSTANALTAKAMTAGGTNYRTPMSIIFPMTAGTTSATTFKIRAGGAASGTTTFNGAGSGRYFGTIPKSSITILEIKA